MKSVIEQKPRNSQTPGTDTIKETPTSELRAAHKCVGVFPDHRAAERAIKELQKAGFDMTRLSIVGRDFHTDEHVVGFMNVGDRMRYWGKLGAFWGGLMGILLAPAFFWVPGIGPIMTGGFLGSAIMGMIEGGAVGAVATGGLSAVGAGLFSIGIPRDSVLRYERALKADKYLLAVHGTESDAERARELLSGADEVHVHSPS